MPGAAIVREHADFGEISQDLPAFVEGKHADRAAAHHVLHGNWAGDAHPGAPSHVLEEGAVAPCRQQAVAAEGIIEDACYSLAPSDDRGHHCVGRQTGGEIRRAIERIDNDRKIDLPEKV